MRKYLAIIFSVLLFVNFLPSAQAQQTLRQGNLAISPFLFDVELEKGQVKEFAIGLVNLGTQSQRLNLSINDFVPVGNEGDLSFLEADQQTDPRFSIASWIKITKQPKFILAGGESTEVKFSITPPLDAEPGTHFGGLLFGVQESNSAQISGFQVSQKLGALVIVNLGKAQEQGQITEFKAINNWKTDRVLDFFTGFANTGNAHVKPKGEIEIRNLFGKVVATGQVNKDAGIVLPETTRNFQTKITKPFLFGYYSAEVWLQFGNPKTEIRQKLSLWFFPVKTALLILLIAAMAGVGGWFGLKRYNRYIIAKATKKKPRK